MLSLQELEYTKFAVEELRVAAWATKLLERLERSGGLIPENAPLMFEVRFAHELHRQGVESQYEYAAGVGDSTVDFRLLGDQEWLVELVSVRESEGLKAATHQYEFFWTRELSSDAPDPRQTEEAEMIVAVAKIAEKVYSAGQPTKFPMPASALHAILVDMRGYLGKGGDTYDYTQIANGAGEIPNSEWPARRFWQDGPIRGLFEQVSPHPLKGAATAQERIHLLGFVAEREYRPGEIQQRTYFRPNPALLPTSEGQWAAYRSFPLARGASAA